MVSGCVRIGVRGGVGEGSRISLGGLREGHAWEFRKMENCTNGEGDLRKGSRIGIGERVGSWG